MADGTDQGEMDDIDMDQLRALERLAEERDRAPRGEPVPVVEAHEIAPDGGIAPRRTITREEAAARYPAREPLPALMMVAPDGTASALIDAGAIDARLAGLEARLEHLTRILTHLHGATLALCEVFRVHDGEIEGVLRRIGAIRPQPTEEKAP